MASWQWGVRNAHWGKLLRGSALVFAGGALLISACAQGGGSGGDDDGSGASGTTTTTTTGMGGNGGSGAGSMTTTTTTGTGGDGGSGGSCSETPCKTTLPQCGCDPGQKCSLDNGGNRECTNDGTVQTGDQCSGNNCLAGNMCLNSAGMAMCRKFCATDNECNGPGGLCVLTVDDGMGGSWADTFCSENCDPISGAGCNPTGAKCELGQEAVAPNRTYSVCMGSGSGIQDAVCTGTDQCASGFGCFNIGTMQMPDLRCLKWCDVASPLCDGAATCYGLTMPFIIGSKEYGVCANL